MNHYLTDNEQKKLLSTIKQYADEKAQRDYYIVSALIASGCRIGEFMQITIGSALAALETGYLYIPCENRKGGKHDHSVYLTKSLRIALTNLIDIRDSFNAEHYLIAGRTDQEPMSTRNMQQRVKSWANHAGLSHLNVTPHFFRHTMAMNLIRNSSAKEPLRIVKSALGHRNINTTAIYTAATREEVAEAMEEADNVTPNRITLAQLRAFHKSRQQKAV